MYSCKHAKWSRLIMYIYTKLPVVHSNTRGNNWGGDCWTPRGIFNSLISQQERNRSRLTHCPMHCNYSRIIKIHFEVKTKFKSDSFPCHQIIEMWDIFSLNSFSPTIKFFSKVKFSGEKREEKIYMYSK